MFLLLFRLVALLALIAFIYFIIQALRQPSAFVKCGRCGGKGFWYAARVKETCDWCKGSGKLPRNSGT